jgi:hypothetical protein
MEDSYIEIINNNKKYKYKFEWQNYIDYFMNDKK